MTKVKIIAEIGVNHNGKMNLAKKLIIEAKKCGADAVKFQNYITKEFVLPNTRKTNYQNKNLGSKISHFDMLKKYEFNFKQFREIINFCKRKKIEFISTPYELKSLNFLIRSNIKTIKIASADLNDFLLHKEVNKSKKDVIISTGMSTFSEIEKVLKLYKNKKKITLLHCTSNYPCSIKSINLNVIQSLKKKFKCNVGYSDHSNYFETSVAAVALGCKVIEKHFTLSKNMKGPDHLASFNPVEFSKLVKSIRNVEIMLGENEKRLQKEEINMKKVSSKSITIVNSKKLNSVVKLSDIKMMRPGVGLNGSFVGKVIGKKYNKNIKKYTQLKISDLKI
jgi:sialic acid synthase SpsE